LLAQNLNLVYQPMVSRAYDGLKVKLPELGTSCTTICMSRQYRRRHKKKRYYQTAVPPFKR